MDLADIRSAMRDPTDVHQPRSRLLCIEHSHNKRGGAAPPLSWTRQVATLSAELDLPVHVDGSRLYNSAAALRTCPATIVSGLASTTLCLSKVR
jgi:threonine aldolase